jgi:hypothetical protein
VARFGAATGLTRTRPFLYPPNGSAGRPKKGLCRALLTLTPALFLLGEPPARAQVSATATPASPEVAAPAETEGDEIVLLNPFVVDASEDKERYKANSTLAATRVRTDINDTASAITVVTAQFLQDTGAKNSQDLLVYTPNTEVAGLGGNFNGQAGQATYHESLVNPSATTRVRGLDAADNTRDYFITDIPWDDFDTGRIDIQRGPNSILFGVGSPAGIINNSINGAAFANSYKYENVAGSYGSSRNSVDLNYVLRPNELAIRISLLSDDESYQQSPAFNDQKRFFAALRWDPKLFKKGNPTSIRMNFEKGDVSSNNPRTIPPTDQITPWFATGDYYGNPGLNKATLDEFVQGSQGSAAAGPFLVGILAQPGSGTNVLSIFNGAGSTGSLPAQSSHPTSAIIDDIPNGYGIDNNGKVVGTIEDTLYYVAAAIPSLNIYGPNAQFTNGLNPVTGGVFFIDKVIQDPSIFDFYNHLMDGPNKKEWQNWKAFNATASQTFSDGRIAFELAFDSETYVSGSQHAMSSGIQAGGGYAIGIDPNVTLADGTPNPNLGRPYVAGSYDGSDSADTITRQSLRFTPVVELRALDFFGRGPVARILGHSVFTGLVDEDRRAESTLSWSQYASDASVPLLAGPDMGGLNANESAGFIDYLGPSLLEASTAAGAHVSPVTTLITPTNTEVTYFDSHWKYPLDPASPSYVDPSAPFTFTPPNSGPVMATQAGNPANYVGWTTAPVTFRSASDPQDFAGLVTGGATKTKYVDVNRGITWQGYFFEDTLVPVLGYRWDSFTNYQGQGARDPETGVYSTNFSVDPASRSSSSGESRSWGGVYHLPKSLTSFLPWDTGISLFYDHSSNFKAEAPRENLVGGSIPNPRGTTNEYGFTVTALKDKISLRVNWYRTVVANATLDDTNGNSIGGLGIYGFYLWAAPTWGYEDAAQVQDGLEGNNPGHPEEWNYLKIDGTPNNGPGDPAFDNAPQTALEKQIVQAWMNFPLDASFYKFYGIGPLPIDPSAIAATGQIRSVFGPNYTDANLSYDYWTLFPNAVTTTDIISKGVEMELSAQPTSNWNVNLNYARTAATHENVDPTTAALIAEEYKFFSGVGGQLRLFGYEPIGGQWIGAVYEPYEIEVATEGHSSPEVAPWRLNFITTYTFDRGPAKGWFIGGADRMEAGKILGYPYDPTTSFLDVNHPWIGSTDTHFDGWIGYSRKVWSRRVNWRIQLNLHNIGEKSHLVADAVETDGSVALARIEDGMTWNLTNTFEF